MAGRHRRDVVMGKKKGRRGVPRLEADPYPRKTPSFTDLFDPERDFQVVPIPDAVPGADVLRPRRPSLTVEATLDLHGRTAAEAERLLAAFLLTQTQLRRQWVRVVTGRGRHSPAGPVLKGVVAAELAVWQREKKIAAFQWEGGDMERAGALLVRLR